ncbi:MAG: nucleoside phosphorylase [Cyclobacteriaceae bacterium]
MPTYSETDLIVNPDGSIYHLNLKPEHVSDKIITVGDPGRVHRVSRHFDHVEFEMNKREFITHVGNYKGKRITVISTGMGTDNVEILMTELDSIVNIDLKKREPKAKKKQLKIVRIGTSASIQEDIRLGSHVISEYGIGLDPLIHFYKMEMQGLELEVSEKLKETIGLPYLPYCVRASDSLIEQFREVMTLGNTLTCHGFYAPQGREIRVPIKYPKLIEKLNYFHHDGFWLTNLEMETAGYYALAKLLGHEMVSVNAIIANRIRNRFSKDPNKVIDSLIKKVLDRI